MMPAVRELLLHSRCVACSRRWRRSRLLWWSDFRCRHRATPDTPDSIAVVYFQLCNVTWERVCLESGCKRLFNSSHGANRLRHRGASRPAGSATGRPGNGNKPSDFVAPAICELYFGHVGNRTRLLGLPWHLLDSIARNGDAHISSILPVRNGPSLPAASPFRALAGLRNPPSPDVERSMKWCATSPLELIGS